MTKAKREVPQEVIRQCPSAPIVGLFRVSIPTDRKALVSAVLGSGETTVTGPCSFLRGPLVRMYPHFVVDAGQRVSVFDQNGKEEVIAGPCSVDLHPDSTIELHRRIILDEDEKVLLTREDGTSEVRDGPGMFHLRPKERLQHFSHVRLAETEAICVTRRSGQQVVILGAQSPRVWIDPREDLIVFKFTGGGDADGMGKVPGHWTTSRLRLQPSQAYFAFPVRTADNTVLVVKLMVFWQIVECARFVSTDDPFGAVFNHIMSDLTAQTARLTFDEFKNDPNDRITNRYSDPSIVGFALERYGIKISTIKLRGWRAEDPQVQRILDQAAAAQTEREVARAQHQLAIEKLEQHKKQLEKAAENGELEMQSARALGAREGSRLASLYNAAHQELPDLEKQTVSRFVQLQLASQYVGKGGGKLNFTSAL